MGKRKRNSNSLSIDAEQTQLTSTSEDVCCIDDQHELFEDPAEYLTEDTDSSKKLKLSSIPAVIVDYVVHPSASTKYAPKLPTVTGDYDLHCIGIDWSNKEGPALKSVENMGEHIAKTYRNLSKGAMKFTPHARKVKVNLPCKASSLSAAERAAKRIADEAGGNKPRLYAIINSGAISRSHASNKTAHLLSTLNTTGAHETGHLIRYQHANRIGIATKGKNKGKKEFQSSRDGSSVMSIYSSDKLTSSQFYDHGWHGEKQVAQHDVDSPAAAYNLQAVFADESSEYLNSVLIPRGDQKSQLFLSLCQVGQGDNKDWSLALHTRNGSGSTRQQVFKNHAEFDDLSFDTVSVDSNHWQVKISPKPSM